MRIVAVIQDLLFDELNRFATIQRFATFRYDSCTPILKFQGMLHVILLLDLSVTFLVTTVNRAHPRKSDS